jgi:hypothetical protein
MLLHASSCSIAVQHMPGGGRLVRGPQAVLAASGGHPQSAVGSGMANAGHQQEVSTLNMLLLDNFPTTMRLHQPGFHG